MNPDVATKLAAMGDIKANAAKLRVALEEAKKNPDDPRSVELRRRLERGMFNAELQSLGKKPFPVQTPKIDLGKAMAGITAGPQSKPTAPEQNSLGPIDTDLGTTGLKERFGDVKETFVNVGTALREGAGNAYEMATNKDLSLPQRVFGPGIAFGSGVANAVGEIGIGAGKIALTQEAEDKVKEFAQSIGENISETEAAKKTITWYEALPPEEKANLQMFGGLANIVTTVFGLRGGKAATTAIREGAEASVPVIKEGLQTGKEVVGQGARTASGALQRAITPSAEEASRRIDDAVGRIIQGTPEDIAAARRALQTIDTTGVEDYAGLNKRLDDSITDLVSRQDAELAKYPERFKPDQTGLYKKVGDETVTTAPVIDAFDGLANAYRLSGDAVGEAKLRQLRTKFETEGLTVKELNDLARQYGTEFKDKAFTKLGDPKPGYNAENFEAVRRGLKEVTRERMPGNVAKELDKQLSDIYDTKILTDRMEIQVQKLYQKVKNRTLMQKVGGAIADVVDLASFGTLRGFVQKLLPSNVGLKTANSLDLQEELAKNLAQIEKLNKITNQAEFEKAFAEYLKNKGGTGAAPAGATTPAGTAPNEATSFNQGATPPTKLESEILTDLAKQYNVNIDTLKKDIAAKLAQAPESKAFIDNLAKEIEATIPNTKLVAAPPKSAERILEKTLKEEGGNLGNIKDIARNTVMPFDDTARQQTIKTLSSRSDLARAPKFQEPKDFLGYQGVIFNIKTPNGLVSEMQVVSPKMIYGKMAPEDSRKILGEELFNQIKNETGVEPGLGHVYYEEFRTMSNADKLSAAGQEVVKKSFDYYAGLQ